MPTRGGGAPTVLEMVPTEGESSCISLPHCAAERRSSTTESVVAMFYSLVLRPVAKTKKEKKKKKRKKPEQTLKSVGSRGEGGCVCVCVLGLGETLLCFGGVEEGGGGRVEEGGEILRRKI